MNRCIIITALLDCPLSYVYMRKDDDYIICADGGITIAEQNGIVPDIVLGDLDSVSAVNPSYNFIRHPKEKDDTDTILCLKYGIEQGFRDFLIIGGIGGRFDHTFSNIQTLAYAKDNGVNASIISRDTFCTMIKDGEKCTVNRKENAYISVFSYSDKCEGITIKGTKYELSDAELKSTFPLGVSNEWKEEKATISIKKGKLLIVTSNT